MPWAGGPLAFLQTTGDFSRVIYICNARPPSHLNNLCAYHPNCPLTQVLTMYTHSSALTTLFSLLNTLSSLIARLTNEQETARKKGLELYNLGEYRDSEAYLTIAATAGDRESQYALAEVIRRRENNLKEEDKNPTPTEIGTPWQQLRATSTPCCDWLMTRPLSKPKHLRKGVPTAAMAKPCFNFMK